MPPVPTPIYHITHVDNLAQIIGAGGLGAVGGLRAGGANFRSIAYPHIQDRRATTLVPCGPRGTLQDYVPFYFAPRSPMLYTINKGNVPGYADGQGPVVHLLSSAQRVEAAGPEFVFTDGHAIMAMTDFFHDLRDLNRVDWEVMRARYWADTQTDSDRSRRRQAEFLVRDFFPWELVSEIGVIDRGMKARTEAALARATHVPPVTVHREWYY